MIWLASRQIKPSENKYFRLHSCFFLSACVVHEEKLPNGKRQRGKHRKAGKQENRKSYGNGNGWLCPLPLPLPLTLLLLLLRCLFKVLPGSVIMKDIIQPVESGRPQTRQLRIAPLICTHMYKCVFPPHNPSPPSTPPTATLHLHPLLCPIRVRYERAPAQKLSYLCK